MSALQTVFDAQFHGVYDREIVGNAFGLASALGGMQRRVWAWPVGIVGNVLLFTVFLGVAFGDTQHATLYGQAGRQVLFIVVSGYGWATWVANRRVSGAAKTVVPRWATGAERAAYLPVAMVGVAACFLAFRAIGAGFPAAWWYYLADSWIFVGSALATYAMARGWVDFWLCWLAVDAVGVPELLHFGNYPTAIMYGVYAAFVLWGFTVWRRDAHREGAVTPTDPQLEALA